ncbi:MAG: hypothetical protein PVJ02_19405 [Gemmatimonadota bacterium]|jgi:hypothetical protein
MRLTARDDPAGVKRYSHVRRARGWRVDPCSAPCPGTGYRCTREKDHRGPHVAHGWLGKVTAVWDGGGELRSSTERMRRALEASRHGQVRREKPEGSLAVVFSHIGRFLSSVDHVAFLILLLAFIGFAIQWFMMVRG